MEKFYIRIKRRIDQGKNYVGYYQMVGTSFVLCKVFGITDKWIYISLTPVLFFICWLIGYFHEKWKVLDNEQSGYFRQNSIQVKMYDNIEEIKKILQDE
ncbi:MAG: hypothetical protein IMZ53_13050 [Thermoplasmata archaeon]|nr:hypothetical protein [Thermoplasmata archaeon]